MKSESYRWKIYFFRTNNEIFETDEKIEKIRFLSGMTASGIEDVDPIHLNPEIITWLKEFGMDEIAGEVGFQIEFSSLNPLSSDWRKLDQVAEGILEIGRHTRTWTLYCEKSTENSLEIVQMHPLVPNPSQIWMRIKELDNEAFSWFIDRQTSLPAGYQMTLSTWIPSLSESIQENLPKTDALYGMPPFGVDNFLD